jgi:hypothetical protein
VRPAIEQVATKTFYDAYIPTMRTALILPIIVLALAVVGALLVRRAEQPQSTGRRQSTSSTPA